MFEISIDQHLMYDLDKNGLGQCTLLCGSLLIPRKIDIKELQRAANKLFEKDSALRACFIEKEGKVFQDTKPFVEKEFEVKYFKNKEELDKFGEVYGTIPLKLEIKSEGEGYPESKWRYPKAPTMLVIKQFIHDVKMFFTTMRMGMLNRERTCCEIILFEMPDACGAIIKINHVVSDAWSMMLIADHFVKLLNGEEIESYEYKEHIDNQNKYYTSERFVKDNEFMDKEAEKCPKKTWLWPKARTSTICRRRTYVFTSEMTEAINEYCKEKNTTPAMLFTAAISMFARRKIQKDNFYIGTISLGRSSYKEKNTIGYFVKLIPMLIELDQNDSFIETIEKINKKSLNVFRHQNANYRILDDNSFMFDLVVSYQNATLDVDPSIICTQYYCNYSPGDTFALSIEDRSSEGKYKMYFDYNIKVSEKELDEMLNTIVEVIDKVTKDDSIKISEL